MPIKKKTEVSVLHPLALSSGFAHLPKMGASNSYILRSVSESQSDSAAANKDWRVTLLDLLQSQFLLLRSGKLYT